MSIQVRNLTHIYNKGMPDEQVALDDVSFDIYNGEIATIIGHTGSGKSTLVQHLNCLLKPSKGSIVIGGMDINGKGVATRTARRKVGLVFQYPEYQLFEETVGKDVAFGPRNLNLSEDEVKERVREAIELVGLDYDKVVDRSPFDLSGGQKRRIAIAGVIAMKPEVLVLDEPMAGLDPGSHDDIMEMLMTIHNKENNIIIVVTHNMNDVVKLSDRVLVMDRGRLVTVGRPDEVFSQRRRLESLGLDVPQITGLMYKVREKGYDIRTDIFSVDEAVDELCSLITGKDCR